MQCRVQVAPYHVLLRVLVLLSGNWLLVSEPGFLKVLPYILEFSQIGQNLEMFYSCPSMIPWGPSGETVQGGAKKSSVNLFGRVNLENLFRRVECRNPGGGDLRFPVQVYPGGLRMQPGVQYLS